MQMRVVPVNSVGVVHRNRDLVLAVFAGQHTTFGGVHHVITKHLGPDFFRVNMQAMKMQVGAVLVVQVFQFGLALDVGGQLVVKVDAQRVAKIQHQCRCHVLAVKTAQRRGHLA